MMYRGVIPQKSLIICYSYSGNTYQAAQEIKRQTGAPLCELYPRQPYPMNFETLLAQVRQELEAGTLPRLFPIREQVDEYDTIFVGTPNWCGTVAPPVTSFLKAAENHMEGKLILPFYTHCGGGAGNVEWDIRLQCPRAVFGPGLGIVNDGGSSLQEKIASWITEIDEDNKKNEK